MKKISSLEKLTLLNSNISSLKHMRGRHDQRDHAWNRGMGRGGTGSSAAASHPRKAKVSAAQHRADIVALQAKVDAGEMTYHDMQNKLRDNGGYPPLPPRTRKQTVQDGKGLAQATANIQPLPNVSQTVEQPAVQQDIRPTPSLREQPFVFDEDSFLAQGRNISLTDDQQAIFDDMMRVANEGLQKAIASGKPWSRAEILNEVSENARDFDDSPYPMNIRTKPINKFNDLVRQDNERQTAAQQSENPTPSLTEQPVAETVDTSVQKTPDDVEFDKYMAELDYLLTTPGFSYTRTAALEAIEQKARIFRTYPKAYQKLYGELIRAKNEEYQVPDTATIAPTVTPKERLSYSPADQNRPIMNPQETFDAFNQLFSESFINGIDGVDKDNVQNFRFQTAVSVIQQLKPEEQLALLQNPDIRKQLEDANLMAPAVLALGVYGSPDTRLEAATYAQQSGGPLLEFLKTLSLEGLLLEMSDEQIAKEIIDYHVRETTGVLGAHMMQAISRVGPNKNAPLDKTRSFFAPGVIPPEPHPRIVAALDKMYEQAQEQLRAAGITEVRLFRGGPLQGGLPHEPWTTASSVGSSFENQGGDLRTAMVPAEYIWASHWLNKDIFIESEKEYLVLGQSMYHDNPDIAQVLTSEPVRTDLIDVQESGSNFVINYYLNAADKKYSEENPYKPLYPEAAQQTTTPSSSVDTPPVDAQISEQTITPDISPEISPPSENNVIEQAYTNAVSAVGNILNRIKKLLKPNTAQSTTESPSNQDTQTTTQNQPDSSSSGVYDKSLIDSRVLSSVENAGATLRQLSEQGAIPGFVDQMKQLGLDENSEEDWQLAADFFRIFAGDNGQAKKAEFNVYTPIQGWSKVRMVYAPDSPIAGREVSADTEISINDFYSQIRIENVTFKSKGTSPSAGIGHAMLMRQVAAAQEIGRRLGYTVEMTTSAMSTDATGGWNGYHTWPKIGYNFPIPTQMKLYLKALGFTDEELSGTSSFFASKTLVDGITPIKAWNNLVNRFIKEIDGNAFLGVMSPTESDDIGLQLLEKVNAEKKSKSKNTKDKSVSYGDMFGFSNEDMEMFENAWTTLPPNTLQTKSITLRLKHLRGRQNQILKDIKMAKQKPNNVDAMKEVVSKNLDKMNSDASVVDFNPYTNWYMTKSEQEMQGLYANGLNSSTGGTVKPILNKIKQLRSRKQR